MLCNLRSLSRASLAVLAITSTSAAYAEDFGASSMTEVSRGPGPQQSDESDWKFEVGAGVMYGAKYEGSDNYQVMPIPNASVEYKNGLFVAGIFDGIGTYPIQGENYKVGASIGYSFGRKEKDDRENLRGMGNIDKAVVVDLKGEYSFGPVEISGSISKGDGDYGTTAKFDIGTMLPVSEQLMLRASIGPTWADDDYMQNYFGVTSAQSARSGYSRYDANSGIKSVGISVGAIYNLSEKWGVMFMLNGDKLLGDAKDSPITKEDIQPATFLTLNYTF